MNKIDDNTPLAVITVGQFKELMEQNISKELPEKNEPQKDDRTGIDEISEMTGLSKSAIYKLTSKNAIPHRSFGKRLVFSRNEIKDWMNEQTREKQTSQKKAAKHLAKLAKKRTKNTQK